MRFLPWFSPPVICPSPSEDIVIIGGGIMGCLIGKELQNKGYAPLIIEENDDIFSEGSGNPTGILDPFISLPNQGAESLFFNHAFAVAGKFYSALGSKYFKQDGLVKIASTPQEEERFKKIAKAHNDPNIIFEKQKNIQEARLFFAKSGYVFPKKISAFLRNHLNIQTNTTIRSIAFDPPSQQWDLYDETGQHVKKTSHVILCNAQSACQFTQTQNLPLESVRGQITYLKNGLISPQITNNMPVYCKSGYLTPQITLNTGEKTHIIGATFDRNIPTKDRHKVSFDHHLQNIEKCPIKLHIPTPLPDQILGGRSAFRAMVPDHLPIMGAVPDWQAYDQLYTNIHHGLKHQDFANAPYQKGLYICAGLGSRGLLTAPYLSQLFTDLFTGKISTINTLHDKSLAALHPARFYIRHKIKHPPKKMPHN